VLIESDLLARLHRMLVEQRCGFVGSAVHGLSYLAVARPHQQHIELWEGPVVPESVSPGSVAWERHHLHSAANLFHVQQRLGLTPDAARAYRVAWVGGCVLFDTAKLRAVGGFDFWPQLPVEHCGEDVLAQLRVMARFGGCGMIPSGAYHLELPTTVTARQVDAPEALAPQVNAQTMDVQTVDARTMDVQTMGAQTVDAQTMDAQLVPTFRADAQTLPTLQEDAQTMPILQEDAQAMPALQADAQARFALQANPNAVLAPCAMVDCTARDPGDGQAPHDAASHS
jgi:hypothetical protein